MNKYAEGYPGKRYYQGLETVDRIERLTIDRARALFHSDHANVQAYSGSIAVMAALLAVCRPGETILGPQLDHGGHLSHGHHANISSKLFQVVQYSVARNDERINFDEVRHLAQERRPKVIIAGGTAFPRSIDFLRFAEIAHSIGATLVADISHIAGLVAAGAHQSPFPHADIAVATTHKTLRGPRGALILCKDAFAQAIDRAVFPLLQGGPHQHTQAGIAVCLFEAEQPSFGTYIHSVIDNASALANRLIQHELRLVSGGTDTHLLLADLSPWGLDGKTAAQSLEKAGVIVNANMIPYDSGTPIKPSGIRLGTPALTTRGFGTQEMHEVADLIISVLRNPHDAVVRRNVFTRVRELCDAFPVPDAF